MCNTFLPLLEIRRTESFELSSIQVWIWIRSESLFHKLLRFNKLWIWIQNYQTFHFMKKNVNLNYKCSFYFAFYEKTKTLNFIIGENFIHWLWLHLFFSRFVCIRLTRWVHYRKEHYLILLAQIKTTHIFAISETNTKIQRIFCYS